MDLRDLQVFLSVAKHLNFTRAGEEVHLSQPSVSVRIRELERDLGAKLFQQLGKKVVLTEAGEILVRYAERAISVVDDARNAIEEFRGLERGTLKIGASTTPGMYLIPKTIADFKQLYPKLKIQLGIRDTRGIEEGIIRNDFDFGFVGGHLVGDEVETLSWLEDELVLIVPPDHCLATKKSISTKDLLKEDFILREPGSATRAAVTKHLSENTLSIHSIMEMENPESVKKAVQSGLGIAFISKFAVETELKAKSLAAVKVKGLKIVRQLKVVYRKDKHLGTGTKEFIKLARRLTYAKGKEL